MYRELIHPVAFVLVLGLLLTSVANAADPNLVGWWRFDEGSGTTASDSSRYGNDGTLGGTASWDAGIFGGSLYVNGTGWVDIPPEAWQPIQRKVTIACWAFGDQAMPVNSFMFGAWSVDTNTARQACAAPWSNGNMYWDTGWDGTGSNYDRIFKAIPLEYLKGEWVHWAFTKDCDAGTVYIYANGQLFHSGTGMSRPMTGVIQFTIGARATTDHASGYIGWLDDFRLYNRAMTAAEIQQVMMGPPPGLASDPNPGDNARDVPRDVVLSWTPGKFAATHDVYLGTVFDDVNNASRTSPRGVLASQGQIAATYGPGRLDFDQTYYWRIDEVNAPPTSTIFKSDVWSFTVEPLAYPIDAIRIAATASSSNSAGEGPENTINSSGLGVDDLHSAENTGMWLSSITGTQPTWIQYEFDRVYKLHQMSVWNYNSSVEPVIGFGVKQAAIEYSVDGANWTTLGTTYEFARGLGAAGYAPNTTVDLGGVGAKYVKITANSNWGGIVNQFGLSEVRFLSIPVSASEPSPDLGATDIDVDVTLRWQAGREAAKHNVYLSADEQAVIDGTAPVVTVTSPSYASSLDLAGTYYWRIDEVNDVETPTTWQGDIWNLSTQEYLVVDDLESYNDIETGQEGSNLVYETWVDGFGTTTNGSTIGYTEAFQPSMEKTRIYDGKQSVPLSYNNTTASLSEVTANVANLQAGRDWTKHGIKGLTLRFYGDPNNVPQQMYVKVNNAKVRYDGDAENLRLKGWQMWYIDLASLGVNLSNVTTLTIGLERIGTLGGQGTVLVDGIRLYSYDRQLITPAAPGTTNVAGHWTFDEGSGTTAADSSGNKNPGTITGAQWVAGQVGGALSFDGVNDYVEIQDADKLTPENLTLAYWIKPVGTSASNPIAKRDAANNGSYAINLATTTTNHWCNISGSWLTANFGYTFGEWQHVAVTYDGLAIAGYLNGQLAATTVAPGTLNNDPGVLMFGQDPRGGLYYNGLLDDVRIYNRALSHAEVAGLAGRTKPFDKPF